MKIAQKMSQIHNLHIPVSKEADWIFNTLNRWFSHIDTTMNEMQSNNNEDNKLKDLQKILKRIDLRSEASWLKKVAEKEAYPVVFCHNDLQGGNILFREKNFRFVDTLDDEMNKNLSPMLISNRQNSECSDNENNNNGNPRKRSLADSSLDDATVESSSSDESEPELMIIDFEYCAYNYRGFDIANHFLEWTFDYSNDKFPFYHHLPNNYPNAHQIDRFIVKYLSERDESNQFMSLEEEKQQLLEEIALFSLCSHLLWFTWSLVNCNQDIEFGYLNYAEMRLKEYFDAKRKYLEMKPSAKDVCDL